MRRLGTVIVITSTVIAYACGGGSDTTKKDAAVDSHKRDAPTDAAFDAHVDAPADAPGNLVMLTVNNYLGWCVVKVGSAAYSPASSTISYEPPGTTQLSAMPNGSGFMLGSDMWHHTDGALGSGSGEPGTQTGSGSAATSVAQTTLALGSAKCVWVCCPIAGSGSSCEGLADQCP